jgi:TPR repeat protein
MSDVRPWRPEPAEQRGVGGPSGGSWGEIAFGLGLLYESEGDLDQAARWFRLAAESDRPGAAVRLSAVLNRLADERGDTASEELLAEASRWLSEGLDTTRPDAIGMITDMLDRHQRAAARRGLEPAAAG